MKNNILCKIRVHAGLLIFLFLALPSSPFLYAGGKPENAEAVKGAGKLIGPGSKPASKIIEDKSPGAAKAFDALFDFAYGAQNYKEGAPKGLQNTAYRLDEYPITFINNTDHIVLIRGFGVSEEIPPFIYPSHKHFGQTVNKEKPDIPTELIIENYNPYRNAGDYEFIYDKNIIEWHEDDINWEGVKRYNAKITFNLKEIEEIYTAGNFDNETENGLTEDNNGDQLVIVHNERIYEADSIKQAEKLTDEAQSAVTMAPEPQKKSEPVQDQKLSVPIINDFEIGKYYVQLASFRYLESALIEINRFDGKYPVVIMKTIVNIRGENMLVYRILIGPLNYRDSRDYLQRFKTAYNDAFIWSGG